MNTGSLYRDSLIQNGSCFNTSFPILNQNVILDHIRNILLIFYIRILIYDKNLAAHFSKDRLVNRIQGFIIYFPFSDCNGTVLLNRSPFSVVRYLLP